MVVPQVERRNAATAAPKPHPTAASAAPRFDVTWPWPGSVCGLRRRSAVRMDALSSQVLRRRAPPARQCPSYLSYVAAAGLTLRCVPSHMRDAFLVCPHVHTLRRRRSGKRERVGGAMRVRPGQATTGARLSRTRASDAEPRRSTHYTSLASVVVYLIGTKVVPSFSLTFLCVPSQ
jgi:hypothetical protein